MQREKERTGFLKLVKDLLKQAMEDADQCSDDELSMVVGSLNCERHGFIRPADYVNTDEAMKFLRIRSRNKFFETARKLGIESKKIGPSVRASRMCKSHLENWDNIVYLTSSSMTI